MSALRILIADDHEVTRRGIRVLLENHPGWEVCGEAVDGREAVGCAAQLKPDLVLLDIAMPNLNGIEATRQILSASPRIRVLILTMHDAEEIVREVLVAGALGFLLKSDAGRDLVAAVEALQQGRTFFTGRIGQLVIDGYLHASPVCDERSRQALTPREREVIQLLAEGKTTKEVAIILDLSVKTAETHRMNVMRKLNAHSVVDLTHYAVRNGIVHVSRIFPLRPNTLKESTFTGSQP
ncbi:MAG TPA: response regulator transcription factor [Candidatus Sulfotelmatobacter sp.]|nr:response regulator transcription factor [Candidatus Sulfotelmatobacter sp.]